MMCVFVFGWLGILFVLIDLVWWMIFLFLNVWVVLFVSNDLVWWMIDVFDDVFLFLNFCILILRGLVLLLWIVSVLVFNHSYTSWWNVSWDFNGVMCFNTTFLRVCSSKHRHMKRFYNLYMFNNVVRKWICFLKMMTAVFLFLNGWMVLFVSICIYF